MRFVRVTFSKTRGRIVAVIQQDTPFLTGGIVTFDGEECETRDLGMVGEQAWRTLAGEPCGPTQHILERLERELDPEIVTMHNVPCTLEGVRRLVRERGPQGIPAAARAWLANVLPQDQVEAMALARGLPISAMKAAEAIRNRRDPHSGSRMHVLERYAQKRANAEAGARHAKRLRATEKAAEAEGAAAFRAGVLSNPYRNADVEFIPWARGFQQAAQRAKHQRAAAAADQAKDETA